MLFSKLHSRLLIATAFLVFPGLICAQEPATVLPSDIYTHRIGERGLIHSSAISKHSAGVTLKVIVDEHGRVISAHAINGLPQFNKQAERIELRGRFKPFEKNGRPVRVTFEDYVSIVAPEEWASPRVPFPPVKNLNSLHVHLERGNCFGPCIIYSVDICGDGQVDFHGGLGMLIPGHHRSRISNRAVLDLLTVFRRAEYFSVRDRYAEDLGGDGPLAATSIDFDGRHKSVLDFLGTSCGLPEVVRQLEDSIDEIAGTEKWRSGNSETAPALLAEHWNFQADTKENRALYANVAANGSPDLIQLCINQPGLPAPLLSCALESAAAKGNLPLVRLLIEQKAVNPNAPPCSVNSGRSALIDAAAWGNVDVVQEVLKHHPDINVKFRNDEAALAFALESGPKGPATTEIVKLLLAAGADVNNRDTEGRTPIFYACHQGPEVVRALIQAGADVNAQDHFGQTAMLSCYDHAARQALIDAGATPSPRNPESPRNPKSP